MSYQRTEIPESDIQHQVDICAQLRAHFTAGGRQPHRVDQPGRE